MAIPFKSMIWKALGMTSLNYSTTPFNKSEEIKALYTLWNWQQEHLKVGP